MLLRLLGKPALAMACLLGLTGVSAQQHAFRQYTTRDGLAQSQVRCMAQDGKGYLWLGTLGGASRFDGSAFVNFALQEGLPDAQVSAMVTDAAGTLWMASGTALVRSQGQRLITEQLPDEVRGSRIMGLAADARGRILIGTDGGGLFIRDDAGVRSYPGFPADTATHIRSLLLLADGRLLVGLRNGALVGDDRGFHRLPVGDTGAPTISAMAEGANGTQWFGTVGEGLIKRDPDGTQRVYDEEDGLLLNTIRCLFADREGRIWIGTKLGLNMLEPGGRLRVFTIHQGMPNDNINCIFQDDAGDLWFGTDGAGVLRYTGDRFLTFTVKDGLCSDLVMNVTADAHGDLWLGTYDNGVCRLDGMAMVNTSDGLPNNTVWSGTRDRDGLLWFGTSDGLACIERGQVKPLTGESALAGQRVMALYQDPQGTLWCGLREGLAGLLPDGRVVMHASGPDGPGRLIRAIVSDAKGTLWLGTEQGISSYDGRRFRTWTTNDGLCDNTVRCLLVDGNDRIWAGTSNGISCFAGQAFRTVRPANDFGSGYIDLLIDDELGRIWAGTNNGIYVFHPDSILADPARSVHIGSNDGLRSLEFNQNAAYRDNRGRLFLGSSGGLVFHDVMRHPTSELPKAPRIHLTRLRSFLQPTDWSQRCDSLDERGLPIGLHLPYRRNHLTFDFAGIALGAPERVRYRYRLHDLDPDWLPATDVRFASYSNLAQGHYRFEVMASLDGGPWSPPEMLEFSVEPPFWLRWWFFALCAVAIATTLYFTLRFQTLRRQRREKTRQLVLRSRMLQLEQQALNANMNRHFVFNALNSIQYHINKQDRTTASRYLSNFAKLIRKNLDASQSDTTSLAEELERLELYLRLEHMRFKDRFQYTIKVEPGVDAAHIRLPAMMLQPYVENSIWHGILPMESPGHVQIRARPSAGDRALIVIQDDGIGVENSRSRKQGVDSDHISRGIEITKGRADVLRRLDITDIRINGPFEYRDLDGSPLGTRVEIELPMRTSTGMSAQDLQTPADPLTFGT